MKQKIALFAMAGVLSGCAYQPPEDFNQHVYEGYPCGEDCSQFKAGFTSAQDQKFTQLDQCDNETTARKSGCRAAVNEYLVAQNENERARDLTF